MKPPWPCHSHDAEGSTHLPAQLYGVRRSDLRQNASHRLRCVAAASPEQCLRGLVYPNAESNRHQPSSANCSSKAVFPIPGLPTTTTSPKRVAQLLQIVLASDQRRSDGWGRAVDGNRLSARAAPATPRRSLAALRRVVQEVHKVSAVVHRAENYASACRASPGVCVADRP